MCVPSGGLLQSQAVTGLSSSLENERIPGEGLFTRACSDRTRANSFKLKEGGFRLATSKKFLTLRVVRPWNRLPREAVAAFSLEVFKARLDGALSNLVWWKVCPPMAERLE